MDFLRKRLWTHELVLDNAVMTCPVRRGKDGIPLGCWGLVRTIVLVIALVAFFVYSLGD